MKALFITVFLLLAVTKVAWAIPTDSYCAEIKGQETCIDIATYPKDVCAAIKTAADEWNLDPNFFARLIWKESHFNPNAQSHMGAQGIAQFMPTTAKIRGLKNAYNPVEALNHSAKYLKQLSVGYGNLGMAAAAYNAGETRVDNYLRKRGYMPTETRYYVKAITDISVEEWRANQSKTVDLTLEKGKEFHEACVVMARTKKFTEYETPASIARAKPKPWGVEIAAHNSKAGARKLFSSLKRQYGHVLRGEHAMYVRKKDARFGGRVRYAVRIGRGSKASAQKLCAKIRTVGGICAVRKN